MLPSAIYLKLCPRKQPYEWPAGVVNKRRAELRCLLCSALSMITSRTSVGPLMATVGWFCASPGLAWQNGRAFSQAQRSSGVESGWRNTAKAYSSGTTLDSSMPAALSRASILEIAVASTSSRSTVFSSSRGAASYSMGR